MSLYGRWHDRYRKLAARHLGSVYSVHFFCPAHPQSSFDLLYRAQMASLYPLSRCFSATDGKALKPAVALLAAARSIFIACDLEADSAWCSADWCFFWTKVYERKPSE